MCYKTYELHSAHSLLAPVLAYQAALKGTRVKLDLLTNIDVF